MGTYTNGTRLRIINSDQVRRDSYTWIEVQIMDDQVIGWIVRSKIRC
ncbi:SH3-like domain-containing protein [Candidatus Chloroploca sp. M-50]|uniref:SH3-like domain-containing protein n=1 Tax=Candidatus Chloroploca mongolica TaxID=2528176 RepID=A0ABS4DG65_9CHLR|nr:SH3-like domain-containing protein [Candidatus Chloroploca mongolica]NCC34012.1 hypothetical protein [Chloroflexia bacterium]